jgi:hypothetical protein
LAKESMSFSGMCGHPGTFSTTSSVKQEVGHMQKQLLNNVGTYGTR